MAAMTKGEIWALFMAGALGRVQPGEAVVNADQAMKEFSKRFEWREATYDYDDLCDCDSDCNCQGHELTPAGWYPKS